MSASSKRLSVVEAFGFEPELRRHSDRSSLATISVDRDGLGKLLSHWENARELPTLQGLTASPAEEGRVCLSFLLDLGGDGPFYCVEADLTRDRAIPDFSVVWPHCSWWQEELAVFHGVRFESRGTGERIQWRLV